MEHASVADAGIFQSTNSSARRTF